MKLTLVQKLLWAAAGIAAVAFLFGLLWIDYAADQRKESSSAFSANFELTDHEGMIRTQQDFAGQWMLVFFGFANCPDICPTTLAEVAVVMDSLGQNADQIQPLFITIDPERDTPMALAEFVPVFDAGIIGLTGTPEQIERTAQSFFIYYERITEAASPGGYTMGHSSQLFLFDRQGEYVGAWTYGTPAEEILSDLKERMSI